MGTGYPFHDLQIHTTWSDGYHSVAQQLRLATAFVATTAVPRLEAIAITDHLFAGSLLSTSEDRKRYLAEIREARNTIDLTVLAGVEATATDSNGAFSIDRETAAEFDWVLCDLSHYSTGTLSDTPSDTKAYRRNVLTAYHAMCDADFIDVISHPFNTGNTTPALSPEDFSFPELEGLAQHMAETGTVFDVMNSMPLWFGNTPLPADDFTRQYAEVIGMFADARVIFQMSSDDHRSGLGNIAWSRSVLELAGVPADRIVRPRVPSDIG